MITRKSVRFDIHFESSTSQYLISECQTYEDKDIMPGIQNYLASSTVDLSKRGEDYSKKEIIIFLLTAYPFNEEQNVLSRYVFTDTLNGNRQLISSAKILIVYYNGDMKQLNPEQQDMVIYLQTGKAAENSTQLVREIDREVDIINKDQYWRKVSVTLEEIFQQKENNGIKIGTLDTTARHVKRLMETGFSFDKACTTLELENDVIEEIRKSIQQKM